MKITNYTEIKPIINSYHCIKEKRERSVYTDGKYFYKIWVSGWTQGDITKAAVDNGFYDTYTSPALKSLIYDESGQRGYIMEKGKNLCDDGSHRNWSSVINNTTKKYRKQFFLYLLEKSIDTKGLHLDFAASNVILYNEKLSLIDLESYGSFKFVFNGKTEWYENFDLNAWWKPLETARRDLDLFYKDYLFQCLDITYKKKINSEERLREIVTLVKDS